MKLLFAVLLIFLTQYAEAFALVNFKTTKQSNLPAVLKAKIVSGDQINGDINAKGNVEITKDSNVIYADEIRYNKNTKIIKAFGNVKIKNLEIGYVLSPRIEIKMTSQLAISLTPECFLLMALICFLKKCRVYHKKKHH